MINKKPMSKRKLETDTHNAGSSIPSRFVTKASLFDSDQALMEKISNIHESNPEKALVLNKHLTKGHKEVTNRTGRESFLKRVEEKKQTSQQDSSR